MSQFELRAINPETDSILGSTPIEDEAGALAAFEVACAHALKFGGAYELVQDGVRIAYAFNDPPEEKP